MMKILKIINHRYSQLYSNKKQASVGNTATLDYANIAGLINQNAGQISQQMNAPITQLGADIYSNNTPTSRGIGSALMVGAGTIGQQVGKDVVKQVGSNIAQNGLKGAFSGLGSTAGKSLSGMFKGGAGAGMGMGMAGAVLSSIAGTPNEYAGKYGGTTKGLDTAYDAISTGVQFIPGIGQVIGGAMQLAKGLGRGIGKLGGGTDGMCVCAGTKVFTSTGELRNIEDLQQSDGIIGWSQTSHEIRPQTIPILIEPRQKECIEIELKTGQILRCSIDHPILSSITSRAPMKTINGERIGVRDWKFRHAGSLKVGDFVGLANNIDYWGTEILPHAYLVGLLIGNGSYTKGSSCRIISENPETWKFLEDNNLGIINHCDDNRPDKYSHEVRTYRIVDGMQLMRDLGIVYQSGSSKTLPKNIGKYTKQSICELIAGLYDTDGSISFNKDKKKQHIIALYQSNKNLLTEIKIQLHKLGIFANIYERKAAVYKKKDGGLIHSNKSYRLEISDISSIKNFYKNIHLNIKYKQTNLSSLYNSVQNIQSKEHNDISGAKQSKIIRITKIGLQTVYNLQANNDHTYLANGIITHNTAQDAVLGSSFFNWNIGMINGFGGKKSHSEDFKNIFDRQAVNSMRSSYSDDSIQKDAAGKYGKKYGLLSRGALKKANKAIDAANMEKAQLLGMQQDTDIANARAGMNDQNMLAYQMNVNGGYQPLQVGRNGMKLQDLQRARRIVREVAFRQKFANGGKTHPNTVQTFDSKAQKLINDNKNVNWVDRLVNSSPLKVDLGGGNYATHKLSWGTSNKKIYIYPEVQQLGNTLVDLSSDRKKAFQYAQLNQDYVELDDTPENQKFAEWFTNNNYKKFFPSTQSAYLEAAMNGDIGKYQDGGSLIPEGALHARKNNMDVPDITKKGIPVVDNNGEQQAEIEKNEIIFRKEITDKIEELCKDGSDEAAIECGKILAKEILENTEDRTGLIEDLTGENQQQVTHQIFKEGGSIESDIQKFINKYELTDKDIEVTNNTATLKSDKAYESLCKELPINNDDKKVINKYVGQDFSWVINGKLRDGSELTDKEKSFVEQFDKVFKHYKLPFNITVRRLIPLDQFNNIFGKGNNRKDILNEYIKKGGEITSKNYVSTSTSRNVFFRSGLQCNITLPKGFHVIVPNNTKETEVIIPRNTTTKIQDFNINNIESSNNKNYQRITINTIPITKEKLKQGGTLKVFSLGGEWKPKIQKAQDGTAVKINKINPVSDSGVVSQNPTNALGADFSKHVDRLNSLANEGSTTSSSIISPDEAKQYNIDPNLVSKFNNTNALADQLNKFDLNQFNSKVSRIAGMAQAGMQALGGIKQAFSSESRKQWQKNAEKNDAGLQGFNSPNRFDQAYKNMQVLQQGQLSEQGLGNIKPLNSYGGTKQNQYLQNNQQRLKNLNMLHGLKHGGRV